MFQEMEQILAQRRQIVFPGKNAAANGELRILVMDGILEERSHARHHLEVAHYRLPNPLAHILCFLHQRFHHLQQLRLKFRVVHG